MKLNLPSFARIRVWQKLAILVGVLLIPIAYLMYSLVRVEATELTILGLEIDGLEYAQDLRQAAVAVTRHRGRAQLLLYGNADQQRKVREAADDVDKAFLGVDVQAAKRGELFGTAESWKEIKSDWVSLREQTERLTVEENYARHVELEHDLLAQIREVGDKSTLFLTPKPELYYLVIATLDHGPWLLSELGKLRAAAVEITHKGGRIAPEDKARLRVAMALVRDRIGSSDVNILTAEEYDPGIKALAAPMKDIDQHVADYEKLIEESLIEAETVKASIAQIFEDGAKVREELEAFDRKLGDYLDASLRQTRAKAVRLTVISILVPVLILILAVSLATFVGRGISRPLAHLSDVANRVGAGERGLRAQIQTFDEIGLFSRQFDIMLDQQVALNEKIEAENRQLNESVLNMLQAVAKLSQRDLTAKAPVAEDVTGAVADALNLMTAETAKVLTDVVDVADGVSEASEEVRKQADSAMNGALDDKIKVEQAAAQLASASKTMIQIAQLALASNEAAAKAISTTDKAQETVLGTVRGITAIRDVIRETEKRIKRLGERSQEIGGVVNLINNIAERTHILALNASMHAASAGEAGRGFAVVANEVQRLAENAREATAQISTLVGSIQTETADTVTTMNDTISQVVEGTRLAEQAGVQMRETRSTTADLVQLVEQINKSSNEQAEVTRQLAHRAGEIEASTKETLDVLQKQSSFVAKLVGFSSRLVESVGVFTLPKSESALEAERAAATGMRKAA